MKRQGLTPIKKETMPLQMRRLSPLAAVQNARDHEMPSNTSMEIQFNHDFSRVAVQPLTPGFDQDNFNVACPLLSQRCPFGGACHTCPPRVQAKLKIGQPGDKYEQEADRVANEIMRMPEPQVQRKECSSLDCKEDEDKILQAKSVGSAGNFRARVDHPLIRSVLYSPGQPLDAVTRSFMEPRFGHDFSRVRVHTDARAAASAQTVQASAYTVGADIYFNAGAYRPATTGGRVLIAHELTHVLQQANSSPGAGEDLTMGEASSIQEQEADAFADSFITAEKVPWAVVFQAPTSLQRACGAAAVGTPGGCTGRGGDIVDFGGSSDRIFLFRVACDEFLPGEEARLHTVARTQISLDDTVEIDGFASEEGNPTFNDNLSCARAHAVATIVSLESGATVNLFKHGATPGFRGNRRSAVISILPPAPTPTPTPAVPACRTPTNPDLSGRGFNPTTDGEITVAISHPLDALTARDLATDSSAAAGRSGLTGPHLGPQDAFRHCFWNCRMTQELGAARAEQFATGHENSGPSAIPFDNQMDLHNNATGRALGAVPGTDCETASLAAVTSGMLRTIRGPHTRPASPVTTDCIGASDQPWP